MRWGSTGNGSFGVGATAYTLSSRDENASYYYYQEPPAPLTASASGLGVFQSHGQVRGVVQAKKPSDKRQGRRIIGSNTRSHELKTPDVAPGEQVTARHTPLIMCAGKGVYGTINDVGDSEDRDNSDISQRTGDGTGDDSQHNNRSAPFRSIAAAKTKIMSEQNSPPRHRTDEELEQIIRDLRDQVFQNQQKLDLGQRQKPTCIASSKCCVEDGSQSYKHHRKHLKNPIERMEGVTATEPVAVSMGSSSMTSSGLLLQRPLSSSHLNRLVAESTIQMVVPAIINEAPPVNVRAGARTNSSNNADGQVSSLDFSSLRSTTPRSRPNSSSGCHSGEKLPVRLGEQNPRQLRSKQSSASTRTRREKRPEKLRLQDQDERGSDSGESYLYLVDVDDNEVGPESLSLSPVGPWVVDDFSTAGRATDTPRSPSVSTCYSASSLGSDALDKGGGEEWSSNELAAMSPRSCLLYFSAYADNSEASRGMISQLQRQPLCRSSACGSELLTSMKLVGLESRATKSKRCSSANVNTRRKLRTNSTKASKQKTRTRTNQTRKRPQSGGTVSSRSSQSDAATPSAR